MLILAVLLVFLPFIKLSSSINLTYILKKQHDKLEPSCLAQENERYKGVGWVYKIPEKESDIPHITTKFIPNIPSEYNCDFSKDNDCNLHWSMRDWHLDEDSIRTYDFIGDDRWEELPTIYTSNATKDFRVQIPNIFKLAFSVRTDKEIEFLICNGWNPDNYPCYYIKINPTFIYLQKHHALLEDKKEDLKPLDSYKAFSKILSEDEWRNFIVSFDDKGKLTVVDVNLNRTVIEYLDKASLKPLYFIVSSKEPALWKIHQNHFLYTTQPKIFRLGQPLTLTTKDMCISLYASTCDNCEMIFFTQSRDNVKKILKHVGSTGDSHWELAKLKYENVLELSEDRINIFVETRFTGSTNKTAGFWAIDNVRVCNENEVKVSFLNASKETNEDFISCQLVSQPNWRPKKLVYTDVKDFPNIVSNATKNSIHLEWKNEDPKHQTSYFISYQGNDICEQPPHNMKRIKSNGFLITNYDQITIENLVPYTHYNIVISSVLHENDKRLKVNTLEEDIITLPEFPKAKIQANDTYVSISWDKIDCAAVYGHVLYALEVSNATLNFSKELTLQTDTTFKIDGLKPFTQYTLKIRMGRKPSDLEDKSKLVLEQTFTTLAGAAPSVENLELYAIGKNSAYMRYDLPHETRGIPSSIKVDRCNALSFKKCKSIFLKVERCSMWPYKFCINLRSLIEHQNYNFKVSLKNYNTLNYGKEVVVSGYTIDRVPGTPSNITYEIVDCQETEDYCNLNVSWLHPYYQNGTITSFNIRLNSTNKNSQTDELETINEVVKIVDESYLPEYTYQIKYIPYSTSYDLSVQAVNNAFKSDLARTTVKTDDIGTHINQSPKLVGKCDSTVVFNLPHLDRRLKYYTLTVVAQDFNENIKVKTDSLPKKISDNLCHDIGETWISKIINVTDNATKTITIGQNDELDKATENVNNKPLKADTKYCFTFIVTNNYRNTEHDVVYYETAATASCIKSAMVSSSSQNGHLYALFLLLLLVPIGFFAYWYIKKRKNRRPTVKETPDNVYESLPFEEDNCVNNFTYDKLLHK